MDTTTILIDKRFQVALDDKDAFIGQGGVGSVYRGKDTTTNQPVAVKLLKRELTVGDPEMVTRFKLEGEALRQLNHPNIVKMLGADEVDGVNYLVMEYVSGGSLRDVLQEQSKLSLQRVLYIALDIADALTRAHRLRILHRDIKPDNVLMATDGTPRLTDFGMARMKGEPNITQDGAIVGTLAYLAPEVFRGETPDERSDIWAFGVMLWEMLLGKRPYDYGQPAQLINGILTEPLPDLEKLAPDLPTALVDLIYRMLSKEHAARIPSVRLIGAELEALIRGDRTTSLQPVVNVDDSTGRFDLSTSEMPKVPTSSTIKAPNNLPNQPTPFVGRERELADLQDLLDKSVNLITLNGAGGIGKTRLALAFAEKQLPIFHDGVYFVPFAPIEDTEYILPTIAESMQFTYGSDDGKQDLINYLREKKMLLVFDNFEHLTSAASIVSDIVKEAPNVCILVASRERLRLRGEQVYEVDGMILPRAKDETAERLSKLPAVKLFTLSAHRVMPDFELDSEETVHDVAEVIRLVGGLPLGIELAAAWLEALPLHEIVTEIESSLDFLETDLRDVPERHRSIRAVFDYSWNLMSEEEQQVFLKLSVFRGGFEREAAQKIAGASLRTLTNLVNKSLLTRDPNGRYVVQKMLRQYAAERFTGTKEQAETQDAHCLYYSEFTSRFDAPLNSPKENAAVEALDVEHENIRITWQHALKAGEYQVLDVMQESVHYYYLAHSWLRESYELFKGLADTMEKAGHKDATYWRARIRQVWTGGRFGKYDEAMRYATGAIEFFGGEDSPSTEVAHALNQISYIYMMQGDYDKAKYYAKKSIQGLEPGDDFVAYYMGLGNLGYTHYLASELQEARDIYEKLNQPAITDTYSPSGLAYGKNNLGEIVRDMGDFNRAKALFREAFDIFKSTNRKRGMAFTILNLGGVEFMQGDFATARSHYERAYELNWEIGDQYGLAHALSNLGNLASTADEQETAIKKYEDALRIRRNLGDKRGIADSLSDLARTHANIKHFDKAQELIAESLQIRIEIGDRVGQGQAYAGRGIAQLILGEFDLARADLEKAQVIGEETGYHFIRAQSYVGLGELERMAGHLDKSTSIFQKCTSHQ